MAESDTNAFLDKVFIVYADYEILVSELQRKNRGDIFANDLSQSCIICSIVDSPGSCTRFSGALSLPL